LSNRTKKERWVREAIAMTYVLVKEAAGRYLRPLCIEWFDDPADLTLEHAPPESIGGRHVAVTCRDCNSIGGHTVDHAISRLETVLEFAERRMRAPMPATIRVGDVERRGEAISARTG
jgi:HNH endonuclease